MNWLRRFISRGDASRHGQHDVLDDWRVVTLANASSGRVVMRLRVVPPAGVARSDFSTLVQIRWPFDSETGMPDVALDQQQRAFERALDDLSWDNGLSELMNVSTGLGLREWRYYARSGERFLEAMNRLLVAHPPYPIEITFGDDPQWTTWSETLGALKARGIAF